MSYQITRLCLFGKYLRRYHNEYCYKQYRWRHSAIHCKNKTEIFSLGYLTESGNTCAFVAVLSVIYFGLYSLIQLMCKIFELLIFNNQTVLHCCFNTFLFLFGIEWNVNKLNVSEVSTSTLVEDGGVSNPRIPYRPHCSEYSRDFLCSLRLVPGHSSLEIKLGKLS